MIGSQARQARWIGFGTKLALTLPLCALWACVGSASEEPEPAEQPAAPAPAAGSQPPATAEAAPAPQSGEHGAASGAESALGLSAADFVEALAGQVGSVCGVALDRCSVTAGCEEIVACAAEHACTGATCYCADARCEAPGPCRSVIDGAPGAAAGAAAGGSRGPAADAAAAVGACIEQLVGATSGAAGAD